MSKVVLVGAGNMGFAMLSRWVVGLKHEFVVVEPSDALRARAAGLDTQTFSSPDELPADLPIDILVIATKPQTVASVALRYAPNLSAQALVISVAAGVRLQSIEGQVGGDIGRSGDAQYTGFYRGGDDRLLPQLACEVAKPCRSCDRSPAVGRVAFIEDESLMDAVTAVSGSGPAYVFHFIEALTAAGVIAGLPADLALLLAKQTVFGAAKLASDSKEEPSTLREQVTSPNGTTAAALSVPMCANGGLGSLVNTTVDAARQRSIELGT